MSGPFPRYLNARHAERTGVGRREPSALSDVELTARLMSPLARCAASGMHPDAWFPVAKKPDLARREAFRALVVCEHCPVRAECLEVSMRQWEWPGLGRHGIWGGFIEAERGMLHQAWSAGVPVTMLMRFGRRAGPSHPVEPQTGQRSPPAA